MFQKNWSDNNAKMATRFLQYFLLAWVKDMMPKTGSCSHKKRLWNIFLELATPDIPHVDKYWIKPKMFALR